VPSANTRSLQRVSRPGPVTLNIAIPCAYFASSYLEKVQRSLACYTLRCVRGSESTNNLSQRFAALCEAILSANGYKIERGSEERNNLAVDIVAVAPNDQRVVVETKLYRSPRISTSVIENAIRQLLMMQRELRAPQALLITTLPGLPSAALKTVVQGDLEFWHLETLIEKAAISTELMTELASFLRDAEIGFVGMERPPSEVADALALDVSVNTQGYGTDLISELLSIRPGRKHWRLFEDWCERALRQLFGDQFGPSQKQRIMEGGYHRTDLIVRITPTHTFWESLARDFRTRYVVFEFKNHTGRISQHQIFMTEKYLYLAALRSVAVIVSRTGSNKSATRAVKGALREAGKLLLLLDVNDIKEMLLAKDRGDDPNNRLIEIFDNTLMDIVP
jgi:Restriction endonuclease